MGAALSKAKPNAPSGGRSDIGRAASAPLENGDFLMADGPFAEAKSGS
jgi:hypothetical protein